MLLFCPLFADAQGKYEVTATSLNVRKLPSVESAVIGGLSKGDVVNVRELKSSWAEIDYKNTIGYISAKYICPTKEEQVKKPEQEVKNEDNAVADNVVVQNTDDHNRNVRKETVSKDYFSFFKKIHFRLTSTLSLGLSNFHSSDARSSPQFGFGLDAGTQMTADFLPDWMFAEVTLGFMSLGNSNYPFPSFSLNVLPIGYRSNPVGRYKNMRLYAVGGVSFQFSDGQINFKRNSKYYCYNSKPTVNLYVKGGVEITDMIAVGVFYMHGLNDVCENLPIGIKNSVFQIYGTFLFDKWKRK